MDRAGKSDHAGAMRKSHRRLSFWEIQDTQSPGDTNQQSTRSFATTALAVGTASTFHPERIPCSSPLPSASLFPPFLTPFPSLFCCPMPRSVQYTVSMSWWQCRVPSITSLILQGHARPFSGPPSTPEGPRHTQKSQWASSLRKRGVKKSLTWKCSEQCPPSTPIFCVTKLGVVKM